MFYTGIDLGLSETSIVTLDGERKLIKRYAFGSNVNKALEPSNFNHPMDRYKLYGFFFNKYFEDNLAVGTVVMEKPFGSFGGKAIQLAELYGIYLYLLNNFVDSKKVCLANPISLKKYFVGTGSAPKKQIENKARILGYNIKNSHEADAVMMALFGMDKLS